MCTVGRREKKVYFFYYVSNPIELWIKYKNKKKKLGKGRKKYFWFPDFKASGKKKSLLVQKSVERDKTSPHTSYRSVFGELNYTPFEGGRREKKSEKRDSELRENRRQEVGKKWSLLVWLAMWKLSGAAKSKHQEYQLRWIWGRQCYWTVCFHGNN